MEAAGKTIMLFQFFCITYLTVMVKHFTFVLGCMSRAITLTKYLPALEGVKAAVVEDV